MQGSARIDELRQKFHENPRRYFAPLANEYRKAGDPEQAIAICRAHLAQQPAHMSGHVVYAQALYDAGRVDESRVVFEKALALDPDNAVVHRRLGDISRQKGDTAEARHWYTRALDADPQDRELAAYIAELTEPLTESEVAATVPAPVASASSPPAESEMTSVADETPREAVAIAPEPEVAPPETAEPEPLLAEEPAQAAQTPVEETPPVAAEGSKTPPAEELAGPEEVEVEISKTEEPPALTDMPGFEADEALFAADEDVELFPDSSSPFVTRTMAELYARQGYNDQALEVYKKLAADNPDDQEIAERIRELSPAVADSAPDSLPLADAEEAISPSNEFAERTDDTVDFGFTPIDETFTASGGDSPSETSPSDSTDKSVHFTDRELGAGDEWDADPWAAGFSSGETEVVPFDFVGSTENVEQSHEEVTSSDSAVEPPLDEPAAEEVAPAASDIEAVEPAWIRPDSSLIAETDRTGDFAVAEPPLGILNEAREEIRTEDYYRPFDEAQGAEPPEEPAASLNRALEEPAAPIEETTSTVEETAVSYEETAVSSEETAAPIEETVSAVEESVVSVEETAAPIEAVAEQPLEAEQLPEEVEEVWRPDDSTESEQEKAAEPAETEHFVAYSPQPPDDEDLPHYTPVGPTIREFFAALGAYRPPAIGSGHSFTARAVVPDIDAEAPSTEMTDEGSEGLPAAVPYEQQPQDEFPLVSDAFANLFPDSPVSDEDSKAAFALSGALGSQPSPPPTRSVATPPSPSPAVEAQPAATQESEDDIRRFREWLDGLAES